MFNVHNSKYFTALKRLLYTTGNNEENYYNRNWGKNI